MIFEPAVKWNDWRAFVQGPASQRLELFKRIQDIARLVFGVGRHVVKFPDVPIPDAKREDFDADVAQILRFRPWVAAIGESISDKEYSFLGVSPWCS